MSPNGVSAGVSAGRLEIKVDGEWGTVCSDSFNSIDAFVACRQLGFDYSNYFGKAVYYG